MPNPSSNRSFQVKTQCPRGPRPAVAKGAHGHRRPGRHHGRRAAPRPPTLVSGGAGCGKTLLALEFLLRGAVEYGEPGLFVAFEETEAELAQNAASLGFNLPDLIARKKLLVEYIHVERSEIEETGEYDLEGLFIRLGMAIDTDRRAARGAGHPGSALWRLFQYAHSAP